MRGQIALPIAALLALAVMLAVLPGVAAADTRVGGTVVVAEDETVGDLTATGGTVVVEGTVDGDLQAYGGDVHLAEGAEVTGIVRAYGGDVRLDGAVGGNALVYAGSAELGASGSVDRSFGAVAGDVAVAGSVGGDANVVAGRLTLASTATIGGDLTYRGDLDDRGATVDGVTQPAGELALAPPLGALYAALSAFLFVGNLLLGALLLWVAPRFADAAVRTATGDPLWTAAAGLAAVVGTAIGIALLAVTVVGLPLAVGALLLAVVLAWVAAVYGRYVAGAWLLSLADVEHRYAALVVGVVGVAVVGLLPVVGPVVRAVVFLFGAGVVALGLRRVVEIVASNRGGLADI